MKFKTINELLHKWNNSRRLWIDSTSVEKLLVHLFVEGLENLDGWLSVHEELAKMHWVILPFGITSVFRRSSFPEIFTVSYHSKSSPLCFFQPITSPVQPATVSLSHHRRLYSRAIQRRTFVHVHCVSPGLLSVKPGVAPSFTLTAEFHNLHPT